MEAVELLRFGRTKKVHDLGLFDEKLECPKIKKEENIQFRQLKQLIIKQVYNINAG